MYCSTNKNWNDRAWLKKKVKKCDDCKGCTSRLPGFAVLGFRPRSPQYIKNGTAGVVVLVTGVHSTLDHTSSTMASIVVHVSEVVNSYTTL